MATALVVSYARPTPILKNDLIRIVLIVCLLATIHMTMSWTLMRATEERELLTLPINCIAWMPGTAVIEVAESTGRLEPLVQSAGLALMIVGSTLTAFGTLVSARRISHHDDPGLLPLISVICWLGWLPVPQPLSFMYHFQMWATAIH